MIAFLLVAILITLLGVWWMVPWLVAGAVLYLAAGAVVLSPIFLWCVVYEVRADRRRQRAGRP
jgi:hypothetical protein